MLSRPRLQVEECSPEELDVLNRRATRLGAVAQGDQTEDSLFWIAEFPVGETRFGVPLSTLRAAIPLKLVTPVPLSPSHVIGILTFQGSVITALSLAAMVGGVSGWRTDSSVLLVVDAGLGELAAIDCEQIPSPVAIPVARYEAARSRATGMLVDVTTSDMRRVSIVEVKKLLDRRTENPDA